VNLLGQEPAMCIDTGAIDPLCRLRRMAVGALCELVPRVERRKRP